MPVTIKSAAEIELMRESCRLQDFYSKLIRNQQSLVHVFLGFHSQFCSVFDIGTEVLPYVFNGLFKASVSFGGTSLIIIVSVVLETMKQIESQMLVRNYKGFYLSAIIFACVPLPAPGAPSIIIFI